MLFGSSSGVYLYISMWWGTALGNAPAPLWLTDLNFAIWKDYILIPLTFVAAGMVVEDRKAIRTVVLITAVALLFIDGSCLLESLSRSWGTFDENKRSGGPLGYGSNQTAAFLAQFAMFFWGVVQFVKKRKYKIICYGLIATTIFATMYTFSRGAYAAILVSVFVLASTEGSETSGGGSSLPVDLAIGRADRCTTARQYDRELEWATRYVRRGSSQAVGGSKKLDA